MRIYSDLNKYLIFSNLFKNFLCLNYSFPHPLKANEDVCLIDPPNIVLNEIQFFLLLLKKEPKCTTKTIVFVTVSEVECHRVDLCYEKVDVRVVSEDITCHDMSSHGALFTQGVLYLILCEDYHTMV